MESRFDAKAVVAAGHPPVAEGVVLVDFDGVIAPFGKMFDNPDPIPGAATAINWMKASGYKVVIFTSRLSKTWHLSEGWDHEEAYTEQLQYLEEFLRENDIPYDDITAEKIPAIAYFDDKAYHVESGKPFELLSIVTGVLGVD